MEVLTLGVEGVVVAAGLSLRANTFKPLLKFGEKTLIEKSIEGMYDICSKIIVVGGYQIEEIASVLSNYSKVELVFNENYKDGMFSSVKKGFEHVKQDKFFFIPGDYPLISNKVYEVMLRVPGDIVIPTYRGNKGHPVLIKSILIKELFSQTDYSNLKEFIDKQGFTTVEVQEEGILIDIDTMEDYKRVCYDLSYNGKNQ
jgi:molybdenum cofactor cytidylyltransferase